jgi:GNAT superfamily N-acetyltransferase
LNEGVRGTPTPKWCSDATCERSAGNDIRPKRFAKNLSARVPVERGDRPALLGHPGFLEYSGVAVAEGRTRVAAIPSGEAVGFASIAFSGDFVELEDLFVEPKWMRQGVGRRLVEDAVAQARAWGVRRIDVTANPHALGFYAKVGFVMDGDVKTLFGAGYRMHLDTASNGKRVPGE